MKYLLLFLLIMGFSGCNDAEKDKRYNRAIEACIKQNGVPMLNGFGRMTECKFRGNLDTMIGGLKLGEIK